MAHKHSVYDTDPHFAIDPITRAIINQSTTKTQLMQYDHNSERFTFEIPRLVDGHDMKLCDKIEIHYINVDAATKQSNADVYEPDDMQLSPESDDVVIFSWLISGNATQYAGTLNFIIRFLCHTGTTIDYAWGTDMHKGISVGGSYSNGEMVIAEYSDVLDKWKQDIFEISPEDYVARMPAIDRKYIEEGLVDETRYNAFREKYPNRIYIERYKDGEEYVYNKIALTGSPDPPEDFDKEDAGYMLDSIPMRLGGEHKDGETAFRKGHIRVPYLSADEFPIEQEAGGFAIPRIYADTAILRNNTKRSIKKADTLDDKCLCVNSRENVSSNVSFYSGNDEHAYCVFKTALWWDCANATGGDIEFILYDITKTLQFLCVIRPNLTGYIGKASSTGNKVDFDLKNILSFGKWAKIRIEYASSVRLYVNDFMIADTTLVNTTTNTLYMQVVSSKAISGNIALANVAFLTSAKKANVKGNHYFDLDNYTDIPTSDSSTGKKIIRWGDDVWHIEECEDFTGEGEYVVVNKKYLRKMLEGVGTGGNSVKMYNHAITIYAPAEAAHWGTFRFSFVSSDPTPINTFDLLYKYADKVPNAIVGNCEDVYCSDYPYGDFVYRCKIRCFEFEKTPSGWGPYSLTMHYYPGYTPALENNDSYPVGDGWWSNTPKEITTISDEVTEVGGGKVYLHRLNIYTWIEATHNAEATIAFYSTSADKIDSPQKVGANSALIENSYILDGYVNDGNDLNEYIPYQICNVTDEELGFKYLTDFTTNKSSTYYAPHSDYWSNRSIFTDTVTEV